MRGRLLPALLALLAVGAGGLAVRTPRPPSRDAPLGRPPRAPVLSPRRLPALLARSVADLHVRDALDGALAEPGLGAAREQSCLVVEDAGRRVYSRNPDRPLIPASNLKLLTGLAALDGLGANARLRTEVRAAHPPVNGVVDGDVWLVGGGDPLLATADYVASLERPVPRTALEDLADRVVAAGVRQVRGRVVGDETRYDTQRYVPTWKPTYARRNEIGPQSALTVNDNFTEWRPIRVPAPSPPTSAAQALTTLLQARGVVVAGPPAAGPAPPGAAAVASVQSLPVGDIVGEMLRESDNLTAELLVKELGRRTSGLGTTPGGVSAVRQALARHGLPVGELATVDGSGLDRSDRASCALLLDALERAGRVSPVAAGLPVAARDGTLQKRFNGTPLAGRVRAKTGSLDGVVGLTGYADAVAGGTLAFSLLANGLPSDAAGRALQERVGAVLVSYPQAPAPAQLAP